MNKDIKFCNVAGVGPCLVGSDDRIICKVSEVPAMQENITRLEGEIKRYEYFSCKTCGGAGSVGSPPDDYYDCPECVDRSNKHDAEVVMRFANMVKGAYLDNFVDGALTVYDVYQSARNHVKDNYGAKTEVWEGEGAEKAKGSLSDKELIDSLKSAQVDAQGDGFYDGYNACVKDYEKDPDLELDEGDVIKLSEEYESNHRYTKDVYRLKSLEATNAKQQEQINDLEEMISQRGIDNTMLRVKNKKQQERITELASKLEMEGIEIGYLTERLQRSEDLNTKLQSNDIPEGAKFKCLGEFTIEVKHACPNCYNESEEDYDPECEICGGEAEGAGYYCQSHQVPWTTQKDIWLAINECRNKE